MSWNADDQTEVEVVKTALRKHIDMDPEKTIQVLCDQCVVDSNGVDDEERAIRTKFRSLVLQFLSVDANDKIFEALKAPKTHTKVEDLLFNGMYKVSLILVLFPSCKRLTITILAQTIRTCTPVEATIVVDKVLSPAISLVTNASSTVVSLVEELISAAAAALEDELSTLHDNSLASLTATLTFLRLSQHVTSTHNADPFTLLKFYLTSNLMSKPVLLQLTDSAKLQVIQFFVVAWSNFNLSPKTTTSSRVQVITARDRVVQLSPIVLEVRSQDGFLFSVLKMPVDRHLKQG